MCRYNTDHTTNIGYNSYIAPPVGPTPIRECSIDTIYVYNINVLLSQKYCRLWVSFNHITITIKIILITIPALQYFNEDYSCTVLQYYMLLNATLNKHMNVSQQTPSVSATPKNFLTFFLLLLVHTSIQSRFIRSTIFTTAMTEQKTILLHT